MSAYPRPAAWWDKLGPQDLPSPCAELRLNALTHNLEQVRLHAPGAKIMAVVKANAYGHGLMRVARTLAQVDAFAVARVDEGRLLRDAGVLQRIVVLQGFVRRDELELCAELELEPVIHSTWQVDIAAAAGPGRAFCSWLKLDTGMHRLGLTAAELNQCQARLKAIGRILHPVPVMSHFANADDLTDDMTARQMQEFEQSLPAAEVQRSLANSAAVLGWPASRCEWVRPGVMLYGVSPFPGRVGADLNLRPVMTLTTRLIAIKMLDAGDAVGYGGDWVCPRPTRLGVAAIGYGDGYPRHAKSGTPTVIRGQRVALIGRVSMDMITLDLTDHPTAEVDDRVVLWGDELPVEEVAACAGTIPYELLCGVTQRVRMVETETRE